MQDFSKTKSCMVFPNEQCGNYKTKLEQKNVIDENRKTVS